MPHTIPNGVRLQDFLGGLKFLWTFENGPAITRGDGSLVSAAVLDTSGSSVAAGGDDAWRPDALAIYQRALPPEFFQELVQREEFVENHRVYTAAVVMWLRITQRLRGRGSMPQPFQWKGPVVETLRKVKRAWGVLHDTYGANKPSAALDRIERYLDVFDAAPARVAISFSQQEKGMPTASHRP